LPTEKSVSFIEENNISFDINPLRFEIAYNKSLEILTDINNLYLKLF